MSDPALVLFVCNQDTLHVRFQTLAAGLAVIATAASLNEAEACLDEEWVRVVVIDRRHAQADKVRQLIAARWPDVICLYVQPQGTAFSTASSHNEPVLALPLRRTAVRSALSQALDDYDTDRKASVAKAQDLVEAAARSKTPEGLQDDGIVRAADSPMADVCEKLAQIAHYDIPVLLMGESGTGKELAARALHARSLRWNKPIVVENCAALPDELLESELFGHVRGAFTGALNDHEGMFARADGGTIFLDEIGEISPAFQVKLLRVLQEGEVRKLGGQETERVDVRVIAATNRDLEEDVKAGRFREDLYYRLTTVTMALPALRERVMDIPVLANAFLKQCEEDFGKSLAGFSQTTMDALEAYEWPGNVRELHNEIKHMVVMAKPESAIDSEALSPRLVSRLAQETAMETPELPNAEIAHSFMSADEGSLKERIEALEARILSETLDRHRWNKSRAARELGLSRVGLRAKLDRYGIAPATLRETASAF
ncbi:MAG: sigma-54-dependent Fis family transcriptional regulator [Rhizobiales bacterium]|nr:sigma-54-dependent Fis family transcriptional regulator [Hyphomicrobiales bacterium]MBO6698197.1 sigma-54-dependent Fis family transcriptional regulator [Hyphomicrobiales bacterium]MBO6735549.1 sigma-54-dependent Fis family transcriptional regulator [Hyphomicrobiales bacterium]MBO6910643.1 sigma-54-dependent Fis family transcriptional regulator [Hyphomicrobiales bacterium]MBO6956076.1 sigma-54-dependent Fis family transcriptional regulator [Hyphomicrobiales bacterium]